MWIDFEVSISFKVSWLHDSNFVIFFGKIITGHFFTCSFIKLWYNWLQDILLKFNQVEVKILLRSWLLFFRISLDFLGGCVRNLTFFPQYSDLILRILRKKVRFVTSLKKILFFLNNCDFILFCSQLYCQMCYMWDKDETYKHTKVVDK